MPELAERIFQLPARRGTPHQLDGLIDEQTSPMYATGLGILLASVQEGHQNGIGPLRQDRGWQSVRERVVAWIRDFF